MNVLPFLVRKALKVRPAEAAKNIQEDLGNRTDYEQDSLANVLAWAAEVEGGNSNKPDSEEDAKVDLGLEPGPLFNTYINILPPPPKDKNDENDEKEQPLFKSLDLGSPTELLSPSHNSSIEGQNALDDLNSKPAPPPSQNNPVSKLNWPFLAKEALYVDIAFSADGESADIAARADGGLMDKEGIERALEELVLEVRMVEEDLRGEEDMKWVEEGKAAV